MAIEAHRSRHVAGWSGLVGGRFTRSPPDAGPGPGLPEAIFPEEGVEEAREPTHDLDESDLVRLAFGGEALVASPAATGSRTSASWNGTVMCCFLQ